MRSWDLVHLEDWYLWVCNFNAVWLNSEGLSWRLCSTEWDSSFLRDWFKLFGLRDPPQWLWWSSGFSSRTILCSQDSSCWSLYESESPLSFSVCYFPCFLQSMIETQTTQNHSSLFWREASGCVNFFVISCLATVFSLVFSQFWLTPCILLTRFFQKTQKTPEDSKIRNRTTSRVQNMSVKRTWFTPIQSWENV